jgi:3-methyl-2-oxobutanoate hydroxymethyltransferase
LLGQFQSFTPKFVKTYANVAEVATKAFEEYIKDVREGKFPTDDHVYHIVEPEQEFEKMFREFN